MGESVLCDISDGIATLVLNRPEKLNAIDYGMVESLLGLLGDLEVNESVGAIILTGAGEKAFSAGADIFQFSESVGKGPETAVRDFVRRGQAMTARMESFPKPIIAAVNGIAFGGGCEITEAVPLAVASDRAVFAKPEIRLGMMPTFGGTQRLARLGGRKRALEALLTGEPFSPEEALHMGLINRIVPHGELLSAARDLAHLILRHSGLATAGILEAVCRGLEATIEEGLRIESDRFARLAATPDLRRGLEAWISPRRPAPAGTKAARAQPSPPGGATPTACLPGCEAGVQGDLVQSQSRV